MGFPKRLNTSGNLYVLGFQVRTALMKLGDFGNKMLDNVGQDEPARSGEWRCKLNCSSERASAMSGRAGRDRS